MEPRYLDRASIPTKNEANFEISRHFEVTTMSANRKSVMKLQSEQNIFNLRGFSERDYQIYIVNV